MQEDKQLGRADPDKYQRLIAVVQEYKQICKKLSQDKGIKDGDLQGAPPECDQKSNNSLLETEDER